MAVEVSEPILLTPPRTVVSVTGLVLDVTRANLENCYLEVQESSDLWQWFTLNGPKGTRLPDTRVPFAVAGVQAHMPYVRLRYIIRGVILDETKWLLQATLNTGAAPLEAS